MLDLPSTIAGRYSVLRHLGTGGMGSVFLARDERLGREVAVKWVHASGGPDADVAADEKTRLGEAPAPSVRKGLQFRTTASALPPNPTSEFAYLVPLPG
ncbi:MAG: hypothetical protein WKF94_15210 [Solirubrobacteraceae bacterium]